MIAWPGGDRGNHSIWYAADIRRAVVTILPETVIVARVVGVVRSRLTWELDMGPLSEELDGDSADIVVRGSGANDVS